MKGLFSRVRDKTRFLNLLRKYFFFLYSSATALRRFFLLFYNFSLPDVLIFFYLLFVLGTGKCHATADANDIGFQHPQDRLLQVLNGKSGGVSRCRFRRHPGGTLCFRDAMRAGKRLEYKIRKIGCDGASWIERHD